MKLSKVRKRSGQRVNYDREKIFNAIAGANRDASTPSDKLSADDVERVTDSVEQAIASNEIIGVEEIQDQVEKSLMAHGFYDVAKQFIVYRQKHAQRRVAQKKLMTTYRDIFFTDSMKVDLKRDNANINTDASMGIMLKLGAESSKYFVDNYVLPEEFVQADKENWIHIHDKDFSLITFNCCQIDLLKLFRGGFSTGHGFLREPNSIRSYASLACIAIQSNQNDMFGGQSINAFDYAMAEGVRKSFKRAIRDELKRACDLCGIQTAGEIDFNICTYSEEDNSAAVENLAQVVGSAKLAEKIYKLACADVEEETHQAMEALIHNFNTLHSRAGAQVPFSSINYGMDISPEGRLVIREVLNAIDAGLGNGETPIFPISVFQLKSGVNYNVDDPNYDLFRQACKVSAKRLFPNFVNIDAPYNLQYYKPGDYNSCVATMGCADGDEIVIYRYGGKFFCEGLKRLWERVDTEILQFGLSDYKIPVELEVWDGENGFVKVKTIVKNPDAGNWTRIKFDNGRSLLVTADHPLYTENRGRTLTKDLNVGDTIKSYFSMGSEIAAKLGSGKKASAQWNGIESLTKTPEIVAVTSIEQLGGLDNCSYDLETTTDKFTLSFINSGNCRTRVMSNVNGREESGSRGNFAFVTINLPKLALEAKGNLEEFFRLYDKYITLCHDYLLCRLRTIEEKHVYNFPFLMGQGVWMDSDKLKPTDKIKDVLKHASYSIGFCGLAECLVALIGKHHGQSDEAQQLGLKIVGHLRERTDDYTKREKRNWTTFGTPAESTAGQFQRANRKTYGTIKGVTDRPYMTNSSHVPVYFPICAGDKIRIEAPYHAICNAGHIAYIEMDGDPTKNISAFEALVRAMHDADMGYFSINHPVDRDPVCGYTGIIANECPHCHRKEVETGTFHIARLRP